MKYKYIGHPNFGYLGLWKTWWCRWWFQNLRSRWPSLEITYLSNFLLLFIWNHFEKFNFWNQFKTNWRILYEVAHLQTSSSQTAWAALSISDFPTLNFVFPYFQFCISQTALFSISRNLAFVSMLTLGRDEKCFGFNSDFPFLDSLTLCRVSTHYNLVFW